MILSLVAVMCAVKSKIALDNPEYSNSKQPRPVFDLDVVCFPS